MIKCSKAAKITVSTELRECDRDYDPDRCFALGGQRDGWPMSQQGGNTSESRRSEIVNGKGLADLMKVLGSGCSVRRQHALLDIPNEYSGSLVM
jgi:hypothetical protein